MQYPRAITIVLACLVMGVPAARAQDSGQTMPTEQERAAKRAETLRQRFRDAVSAEQWNVALDVGMALHEMHPDEGIAAFNVARVFAYLHDPDNAFDWLQKAADAGFSSSKMVQEDEMLIPLRADDRFLQMVNTIENVRLAQFDVYKQNFANAPMLAAVPPEYQPNTPAPLIVVMHGYGTDSRDIFGAYMNTSRQGGAVLYAPQAMRPGGSGYSWRYEDESEWTVLRTIDMAIATKNVETSKIMLGGFSQGANVAFDVALKYPHLIRGAVCSSGQYDLSHIKAPQDLDRESWPRFFLMCGSEDAMKQSAQATRDRLQALGFNVIYKEYKGVGHRFPPQYDAELFQAYQFIMGE